MMRPYQRPAEPVKPKPAEAPRQVALDELRREDACQARAELDQETIDEYAALYQDGTKLPPVEAFEVDGELVVVDGFHRVAAARKAGVEFLRCAVVGIGEFDDAIWHATGVNKAHGLRRSNADKRKAVRMALESGIGSEMSSQIIAKHVGVDHKTVSKLRREWEAQQVALGKFPNASETVTTRDGRQYPKHRAKASQEPDRDDASSDDGSTTDLYAEVATWIDGLRQRVRERLGPGPAIDQHLEAAWRAADDQVLVDCARCDLGGCPFCRDGRVSKGELRSLAIAKGAA